MEAELLPLESKYYGSKIRVRKNSFEEVIKIWNNFGDFTPSERELKKHGYSLEDWNNNIEIDNGWGVLEPIQSVELVDTSHFESQSQYLFCKEIIEKLNA